MTHVIEPAASGRSKCRGCKQTIAKGELRFGERLPNPFADGEMTLWFHIDCGAYRRPESFEEVLDAHGDEFDDPAALAGTVEAGKEHRRLERLSGAERSPSSRARCRQCREAISKDTWRLSLEFFEEGSFNPSGYVHAACCKEYLGTTDVLDRIRRFSPDLGEDEFQQIGSALA